MFCFLQSFNTALCFVMKSGSASGGDICVINFINDESQNFSTCQLTHEYRILDSKEILFQCFIVILPC